MHSNNDVSFTFKILLIGNSGVGKSCVVMRFAVCSFILIQEGEFTNNFYNTIGVDFKMKPIKVNGREFRLQIWDTAGQDRFRTITSSYYRGCHGILVLFDITNTESFENVKMWMNEIEKNASNEVVILLIGNKSDMNDSREISKVQGQELGSKYNIPYMECSAKKAINIEEVFETITKMMIAKFGDKMKPDTHAIRLGNSYSTKPNKEQDDGCCN